MIAINLKFFKEKNALDEIFNDQHQRYVVMNVQSKEKINVVLGKTR